MAAMDVDDEDIGHPTAGVEVWICLDFEATCDEGDPPLVQKDEAELIEFSFCILDAPAGNICHVGQHFCRNDRTALTPFCTQLTGITHEQLSTAGSLADALRALETLLQSPALVGRSVCAVAHGSWDLEFLLPKNCKAAGLEVPSVLQRYVDLREATQRHIAARHTKQRTSRASTLLEICHALHIEPEGRLHSGQDDAKMVALAIQALLMAGAHLTHIDLVEQRLAFHRNEDRCLCLDGLAWTTTAPGLAAWLGSLKHGVEEAALRMVLDNNGRPSGRAIVDFGSHQCAAAVFDSFDCGQLMVSDGTRRVVMLRPLRDCDQGPGVAVVPFPADATAVARYRSMGSIVGAAGSNEAGGKAVPKGVASAMRARPGDWVCPHCQDLVFARNQACRLCNTRKPVAVPRR